MVWVLWETRSCRKQTAQPRAERRRRPPSKDAQTTGALRRQILWLSNRLNRVWKLRPWNGWAEHYDDNNPMIAAEECVVTPRLAELFAPGAAALDAGCDTGRHSAALADISYHVIGTDLTPAMLNIARAKVPAAEFREGLFENLPVDDNAVDLVTSALAVCHALDLSVVFNEFARVLRPGGRILLSGPHPTAGQIGGQAFLSGEGFDLPHVRNHAQPISDYVTAMTGTRFHIDSLVELPYDAMTLEMNPGHKFYPQVVDGALKGLPFVLIWEATLT